MFRKILLTWILAATVCTAFGQRAPRTRVEWGVLGGLSIPHYTTDFEGMNIENKLGWQAGITIGLNFGIVAVEPQIIYMRQGLRIQPQGGGELNLRSNSIDVPVLASLRVLKPLRLFAGPVFTVMNDCKQKSGGDLLDFGRVRPTLTYTVGAGVALMRHMLVELRYNGQFRSKRDVVLPDGSELHKLRSYSVSINFGYLF